MNKEILSQRLIVKEVDMISTKINNKWVKVKNKIFSKVSRIFADSNENDLELTLDVNTEIYPMHDEDKFELKLLSVTILEKNLRNNDNDWTEFFDKNLIDAYEYVMFGTIFHSGFEKKNFFIYGSFGGLLLKIFGGLEILSFKEFSIDSKILLLLRKI